MNAPTLKDALHSPRKCCCGTEDVVGLYKCTYRADGDMHYYWTCASCLDLESTAWDHKVVNEDGTTAGDQLILL